MARPDGRITVCVINLKGGVGKSTIAALLARRGDGLTIWTSLQSILILRQT